MTLSSSNNIISTFLQAAADNPEGVALVQDGQRVSYRQLRAEVFATANLYRSRGIEKGNMVLVFVPMSLSLYRIVLSLFHIGACPVFLDEWVSLARLKECLKVIRCKAMIAGPAYLLLALLIGPMRRIPIKIRAKEISGVTPVPSLPAEVAKSDTGLVTFTTGSTGIPKAANRTHAYLCAQLHALNPLLETVASPCMTLLPIVVLLHLAKGKTAILPPKRFKASKPATIDHLGNAIIDSRPEGLIVSPAIASMLIQHTAALSDDLLLMAFRGIRSIVTGGGPVYPVLAERMLTTFPAAAITAVYGSTEAEPISHITAEELSRGTLDILLAKGLPVGLPDQAAEVTILNLEAGLNEIMNSMSFARNLQPQNVAGEVVVAGTHVLRNYINNPVAEAETKLHVDGKLWHRTGDCGLLDDAGQLYLLGRCNEAFIWNGLRYYPAIVTYVLQVLAGAANSALLLKDNMPVLILEECDRALLTKIKACLAELQLSEARVHFIKKIPKDPRHQTKTDYTELTQMLARKGGKQRTF